MVPTCSFLYPKNFSFHAIKEKNCRKLELNQGPSDLKLTAFTTILLVDIRMIEFGLDIDQEISQGQKILWVRKGVLGYQDKLLGKA